ncbi:WecB/TagA/CpsF family glycosyltransferase [Vibrio sp. SS-MA-C1-2]|uniref:WecB/TagA/CpsF family glycosyltransferase n=1 Tax=Vibrio sp. SS-MA-C1-2 TaxID=2908646 RepID=UPI001F2E3D2E|nr:WecB/TagA/CpsF family glycosyltransferase [Vibrio sp. SS-MA-C1-2]UJF17131.1 WecB/TagA/CpsF family glycosyltransferase [Vibrio sp. SS-MA-C1-2]
MSLLKRIKEVGSDDPLAKGAMNICLNPYSYLVVRNKKEIYQNADNIFIDGQWLCHFLKWAGVKQLDRVSFDNTSLAPIVFSKAENENKRVAVIGSDVESNAKFKAYLKETYPNLNLVIMRDGYFDNKEEINIANQIIDNDIDYVIAGMATPKQEHFLIKLKDLGWQGQGYTCGGFIHQTANKGHEYYPSMINKLNLRFAYRIYDEPKLMKRYFIEYPKFVFQYAYDYIKL